VSDIGNVQGKHGSRKIVVVATTSVNKVWADLLRFQLLRAMVEQGRLCNSVVSFLLYFYAKNLSKFKVLLLLLSKFGLQPAKPVCEM
jgi:hypothetical protein